MQTAAFVPLSAPLHLTYLSTLKPFDLNALRHAEALGLPTSSLHRVSAEAVSDFEVAFESEIFEKYILVSGKTF